MKNILVPTDFSGCATNAVKVGLDLAESYNADLHLYSKLNIRKDWFDLTTEQREEQQDELQVIHNAEQLFAEWETKAKARGIKINTIWSPGNLIETITHYIDKLKIDFIVMGSHGISGKNEYLFGSNTQKVIRRVHIPSLIVKSDLDNYELKKVVFASNYNLKDKEPFEYLLEFIRPFNPEVHLITINTADWFGEPRLLMQEAIDGFKQLSVEAGFNTYTYFQKNWTVDAGVRLYAKKINADLIAVSNHQRHPLKRIFAGSNVESLVNHADIPVLSIDFPYIKQST